MPRCQGAANSAGGVMGKMIDARSIVVASAARAMAKKLPRYPLVPVARVGRLAVALAFQKRQLGAALLWDAGLRAMQPGMGVFALVVDAKDEIAAAFYKHHGFVEFSSHPLTFVLPVATFAKKT